MDFTKFQKIPRLSRNCIITEKIDGTNAQVFINKNDEENKVEIDLKYCIAIDEENSLTMYAGSRTRYITPKDDNFGFAKWCQDNAEELFKLGPGRHYGEWWGKGIQRKYNQTDNHFSLFNVSKWLEDYDNNKSICPSCCKVVPILYRGLFNTIDIEKSMQILKEFGSVVAPGFMNPEGIVIFHEAGGCLFKKTFEKDEVGKGEE